MALSHEEQELLDQLEASLRQEDPRLADTLTGTKQRRIHRKRATLGGFAFIIGLIILITGIRWFFLISVLGFLLMLLGAILGINSWQYVNDDKPRLKATKPSTRSDSASSFMNKLEERWRKRQDGDS